MAEMGIDPGRDIEMKYGVFGAETLERRHAPGHRAQLGIRATDIYGLSEVIGPGVAYECEQQQGLQSARIISCPRSSTRRPARCFPRRNRRESWFSHYHLPRRGNPG